jgi:hypothetical protein
LQPHHACACGKEENDSRTTLNSMNG